MGIMIEEYSSLPLPYSLTPYETKNIILNEKVLSGLTLALLHREDFPQIEVMPSS